MATAHQQRIIHVGNRLGESPRSFRSRHIDTILSTIVIKKTNPKTTRAWLTAARETGGDQHIYVGTELLKIYEGLRAS